MRFDRFIAGIAIILVTISSILLIHGIYINSIIRQARPETNFKRKHREEMMKQQKQLNQHFQEEVDENNNNQQQQQKEKELPPSLHNDNNNKNEKASSSKHTNKKLILSQKKLRQYFWGGSKNESRPQLGWESENEKINLQQNEQQSASSDSCSSEYLDSLPTYDDYISPGFSRKQRHEKYHLSQISLKKQPKKDDSNSNSENNNNNMNFNFDEKSSCDPFSVPFPGKDSPQEKSCLKLLQDPSNWELVEMIEPRFEQRTVKYVVTLKSPNSHIRLLMKLPQSSFATEPFGEVTAFAIDRMLGINRIPPTVLVPFPLQRLYDAAHKVMNNFKMVSELGYSETNFTKWWYSEFYNYVKKHVDSPPRIMSDEDHVWVSLQIRLEGVTELLQSPLRVPYKKTQSGWHRWFNAKWEGFSTITNTHPVAETDTPQPGYPKFASKPYNNLLHASMLALSELSIFDFIILNNDRSPNKNNFVVEGCYNKIKISHSDDENDEKQEKKKIMIPQTEKEKYCSEKQISTRNGIGGKERAHRGHSLTFVHLDHGMSFHGFSHVNNPIAKKVNSSFCLFYRPLMERIRCFLAEHQDPQEAEVVLRSLIPEPAQRVLGKRKVRWMIGQLTLLIERKNRCVQEFGEDIVLQPKTLPDFF